MKLRHAAAIIGMASLVAACTKSAPSSVAVDQRKSDAVATTPVLQPFQNLGNFKGKPPDDLLKDPAIGQAIRAIVPQPRLKCLDDALNYLPDMQIDSSGAAMSSLNGSEVDRLRKDFLSVSTNGAINIVLQCDVQTDPMAKLRLFTNEGIRAATSKATLDWLYGMTSPGDVVEKSDGKEQEDIPYERLFSEILATAAKPHPANVAVRAPIAAAPAVEGQWQCRSTGTDGNAQTFFLFKEHLLAYNVGKTLQLESSNFDSTGAQRHGTFEKITRNGTSVEMSIPYVIEFRSAQQGHLAFDMKVNFAKGDSVSSNECVPMTDTESDAATRNRPAATKRVATQAIKAGAVFCTTSLSLRKAEVLKGINSSHLPDDCQVADAPIPVEIVGSDALGNAVIQNSGGQAIVRYGDLQLQ